MKRVEIPNDPEISWKNEGLVAHYIKEYMDILFLQDGRVKSREVYKLDVIRRILSHHVVMEGVNELEDKMSFLFRAAFNRLKKEKQQNTDTFRNALQAEIRVYFDRPINTFWIIIPLHCTFIGFESPIILEAFDEKIFVQDWEQLNRATDLSDVFNKPLVKFLEIEETLLKQYTPLKIISHGRGPAEAHYRADKTVGILRYTLNLNSNFLGYSISFGRTKPLSKYVDSPLHMVFANDGSYDSMYVANHKELTYEINEITPDLLGRSLNFLAELKEDNQDGSIARLIFNSIYQYGRALDTKEWELSFLALWQVLETVTLSKPGDQKCISRTRQVLEKDKMAQDLFDVMKDTRNDMVHRGSFPQNYGHFEVQMLKSIVDRVILKVLTLNNHLKTEKKLEHYYENATSSNIDINAKRESLDFILQSR